MTVPWNHRLPFSCWRCIEPPLFPRPLLEFHTSELPTRAVSQSLRIHSDLRALAPPLRDISAVRSTRPPEQSDPCQRSCTMTVRTGTGMTQAGTVSARGILYSRQNSPEMNQGIPRFPNPVGTSLHYKKSVKLLRARGRGARALHLYSWSVPLQTGKNPGSRVFG